MDNNLLEIKDLVIEYHTDDDTIYAVNNINLSVKKGETFGLVGETGAGKTTIAKSILRVLPQLQAKIKSGEIYLEGENLLDLTEKEMRKVRGNRVAMIFQDPMTALNPIETVGFQIAEAIRQHNSITRAEAERRACDMLETVGIPMDRYSEYPHQFSGGMKQRVVIAMALACNPGLLLADEPTTALDVTIQAQVLDLMRTLKKDLDTSVLLITHDLGVVADFCDSVAVAYAGEIVERGTAAHIFKNPSHPYTLGLFDSLPRLGSTQKRLKPIKGLMPDPTNLPEGCRFCERCPNASDECAKSAPGDAEIEPGHIVKCFLASQSSAERQAAGETEAPGAAPAAVPAGQGSAERQPAKERNGAAALLEVRNLNKYFKAPRGGVLHAVDDINFTLEEGRTLGVVGESGCGKTTLGRTVLHLLEPTSGQIFFEGEDITAPSKRQMHSLRGNMQIIFQDPFSSLNPRMTVSESIMAPLKIRGGMTKADMLDHTRKLMDTVGLAARFENTYPHELDGGRRQRIGIARALALEPKFIVCDEPVSALDVSIQAQIINLMLDLQEDRGLAYMFVTHDLSVVRYISDDIMVMYLGQMVEKAPADELFNNTCHPYSQALLSAIPVPDIDDKTERILLKGEITSPINPKPGCRFMARCRYAADECTKVQVLEECSPGHFVSCCKYREIRN